MTRSETGSPPSSDQSIFSMASACATQITQQSPSWLGSRSVGVNQPAFGGLASPPSVGSSPLGGVATAEGQARFCRSIWGSIWCQRKQFRSRRPNQRWRRGFCRASLGSFADLSSPKHRGCDWRRESGQMMSGKHFKAHEVSCCIKYFIFGFNIIFWVSAPVYSTSTPALAGLQACRLDVFVFRQC